MRSAWTEALLVLAAALLISSSARAVTLYEKDDFKIKLGGYAQFLASSTEDAFTGEHVSDDTSRLRLNFRVLTGTPLSVEAAGDATYTFGSVLDSYTFLMTKDLPPPTFYDLQYAYIDEGGRYGTLSLYRAMVTWEAEKFRIIVGRQRLAYGAALFWSPIDIWNPVSPLSLEPQEKTGVDGVSGIWWPNDKLSFTALASAADEWDEEKAAVSASYRIQSYTFDFLAGKYAKDQVYGFDFVGYVGDAGLRGECTYTVTDGSTEDFPRAVIGMDYAFANSLYLAAEYYYNGGPFKINPLDPLGSYLAATGADTLNRNFVAGTTSYDLNPIMKGSLTGIYDIDKGSWLAAPALEYLATDTLTVSFGGQIFGGSKNGEYGLYPDLAWLKIRTDF